MPSYYIDMETTGLDPIEDSIITIQYQELERRTGRPVGELQILKSWEADEPEMLETLVRDAKIDVRDRFAFMPVGYSLAFKHKFLRRGGISLLDHPCLDLHHAAILMNCGELRGSGLDRITGKAHSGVPVPVWHDSGRYDMITQYVERKAEAFCDLYGWLLKRMPEIRREFAAGRA